MNATTTTTTPTPTTDRAAANAGLAARLYGALDAGDLDTILAALDPDVVLHVPGTQPLAGEHRGREAVLGFVQASSARAGGTEEIDVLDVLGGERHAAVYCHVTATREGREPLLNDTLHLLEIVDGRVTRIWFHNRDAAAVDAFWR